MDPNAPAPTPTPVTPVLAQLEADVAELKVLFTELAPVVSSIVSALRKLQPSVSEILAIARGLHLI